MPLCFTVPIEINGRRRNLTVGGNLRSRPRCYDGVMMRAVSVDAVNYSLTYFVHAGSLWKKAVPQRDVVLTKHGMAMHSEVFGIPFAQPEFANFDFTRPPPEALLTPGWRDEVARIERRLADDVIACGGDLYIKCATPKILVRWPRQTTSKPTIGFAEAMAAVEDQETTCFSMLRLQDVERFIARNRAVPDRFPLRIEILSDALSCIADEDDIGAFAAGTKAWLTAKLDDQDPATALLRHGYGLLPVDVLEDFEEIRDPAATGTVRIMEAVGRIHKALADDGVDHKGGILDVESEVFGQTRYLGRRIARMTRLAVRRWEYERPPLLLASEDEDALGALADPAGVS